jgi:hypothetical protein
MTELLVGIAIIPFAFTVYQFSRYCCDEHVNVTEGFARLFKKFRDDFMDGFTGLGR